MPYCPTHIITPGGLLYRRKMVDRVYQYQLDERAPKLLYTEGCNCSRLVLTIEGDIYDLDKNQLITIPGLKLVQLFPPNKSKYSVGVSQDSSLVVVNAEERIYSSRLSHRFPGGHIDQSLVDKELDKELLSVKLISPTPSLNQNGEFLIVNDKDELLRVSIAKDDIISHMEVQGSNGIKVKSLQNGIIMTDDKAYQVDSRRIGSCNIEPFCSVPIRLASLHDYQGEKSGVILLREDGVLVRSKISRFQIFNPKLKIIPHIKGIVSFVQFNGTTGLINDQNNIYTLDLDYESELIKPLAGLFN